MKIFYTAFSRLNRSVNDIYVHGLREAGCDVVLCEPRHKNWKKYGEVHRAYRAGHYEAVVVGYDSPLLVLWLRLISRGPIIYNALCSGYERMIISRRLAGPYSPRALYFWMLDFLAARAAFLVMLESQHQIDYFKKLFLISQKKCFLAWTGTDDRKFRYNPSTVKFERFTVIFKGQFLPEAGAEYVVQAAKKLEDSGIDVILSGGGPEFKKVEEEIERLKPKNLITRFSYLQEDEMVEMMQKSHIIIGQVSGHPRLERTIPHKCYEALALGVPYLTGRNAGVLELLEDGETCIACNPADADDLAAKILWAKNHPKEADTIGENGYKLYQSSLTSKKLAEKLISQAFSGKMR